MPSNESTRARGKRILEALTRTQQETLVGTLLTHLKPEHLERLCSRLDDEIARAVRAAGRAEQPTPTSDRVTEAWRALMVRWSEALAPLADSTGPYVGSDASWDEGWLDFSACAKALEAVAADMQPWLAAAAAALPDEGPADAMAEIDEAIRELPEEMTTDVDAELGPQASACVVGWTWHTCGDPTAWVAQVDEARRGCQGQLDPAGVMDAVATFPPEARAALYALLRGSDEPLWKRVRLGLSAELEPAAWYRDAEEAAARDRSLVVPFLQTCLRDGHLAQGLRAAERALQQTDWEGRTRSVRTDLLAHRPDDAATLDLMLQLATVADDIDLVAAADLQHHALRDASRWDLMRVHFDRWQTTSCTALRASWIDQVAKAHYGASDGWIHWLLGGGGFTSQVNAWLGKLRPGKTREGLNGLEILTVDVLGESAMRKSMPNLLDALTKLDLGREHAGSRRAWIAQAAGERLRQPILDWWKTHAHRLVPDPSTAHNSRYEEHATWLMALSELDEAQFIALRDAWKKVHGLKRNLWSAVEARERPRREGRR